MSTSKHRRKSRASKVSALLLPERTGTEDEFEEIALPDGCGVWLKALSGERVAKKAARRMTEDDREQLELAALWAERLAERLSDVRALGVGLAEQMSDKDRDDLERAFVKECKMRGVALDAREKGRIWEELKRRRGQVLRFKEEASFERDVRGAWLGMALSLRRKLLEVPSVRWLLFSQDGLARGDERPYKPARMLLTDVILFLAAELRSGTHEARADMDLAEIAGNVVGAFYPTLAEKMHEPVRIGRIRAAIDSAATSTKKKPWKLIAATWGGIEANDHYPRWRIDYNEYTKTAPKRT